MTRPGLRAGNRLVLVAASLLLSSCDGGPALNPVRGVVLFQGQPAEGATVVCQPVNGPPGAAMPSGVAGPDGAFTLATHPGGAGAPAGDYLVLVTWYSGNAREQANPKNKLPPIYAGPQSPLRITVRPGESSLDPFKLTE